MPNEIIYSGELANSVCVKGQPLFEQDDADDRAAVDRVRRLLQQAQDQLANLRSSAKPTAITQAQATLRDAKTARDGIVTLPREERERAIRIWIFIRPRRPLATCSSPRRGARGVIELT